MKLYVFVLQRKFWFLLNGASEVFLWLCTGLIPFYLFLYVDKHFNHQNLHTRLHI